MGQALSADRKHSKAQVYRNSGKSSLQGFGVRRALDRLGSFAALDFVIYNVAKEGIAAQFLMSRVIPNNYPTACIAIQNELIRKYFYDLCI